MSNQKTITVDGLQVTLIKFNPTKGLAILARLQNLLGGSVIELAKAKGQDTTGQIEALGEALDSIVQRNTPEAVQKLIVDIVASGYVTVETTKINNFDELAGFEDADALYLGFTIAKEQIMFSFETFVKKLMSNLASLQPPTESN